MKKYILYYVCKYHPRQCNGTHIFYALPGNAREIAIQWMRDTGGLEGLEWGFREIE